jgi:ATP-dependent metalloprotease
MQQLNRQLRFDDVVETYASKPNPSVKMKQQYLFALEHRSALQSTLPKAEVPSLAAGQDSSRPLYFTYPSKESPWHWVMPVLGKLVMTGVVGYCFYLLYTSKAGGRGIIDSKKQISVAESSSVRFSDVQGIDECKAELQDIVDFLKHPSKYLQVGAKLPKGVLLTGSPGTGKTLLAKAIAGEAGVKFFYASGSDFEEVFVGLGAKRIRELFKEAKLNAPCIVFIDEIDAIGGRRGGHDANFNRQSLNQLLVEIDGFKSADNVIVIGATNLPQNLDPALMRSGRFDKEVKIPFPDVRGRKKIFKLYLSKVKHDQSVDPKVMAHMTYGLTGADIANLVNSAVMNSVKAQRDAFTMEDFDLAVERKWMGVDRKSLSVTETEKMNTALHETGHVLVTLLTKGPSQLYKVNILPRGNALGVTINIAYKDKVLESTEELLASIDISMGGRCAEELFVGREHLTTGCRSDMTKAVSTVYGAVMNGMFSDYTGLVFTSDLANEGLAQRNLIDNTVERVLKESRLRVMKLLQDNSGLALYIAKHLKDRESLSAAEVKELVERFNHSL